MQCTVNRGAERPGWGGAVVDSERPPPGVDLSAEPAGGKKKKKSYWANAEERFVLAFIIFSEECKERELTSSAFIFHKGAGWPQIVFKSGGGSVWAESTFSQSASSKGC